MTSMGVPRKDLPHSDDIQIMAAQMATKPLVDGVAVGTELIVGPNAEKPLRFDIPLLVSDMSFGALSEEAQTALAKGAELAGTGICSGEGGMLPEEQQANSRCLYGLASAQFGDRGDLMEHVQAFHFTGGQGAKTGTGGHLPGSKPIGRISQVRRIPEGEPAIWPSTFTKLHAVDDFRQFGYRVRELSGGIPIGMPLSANHVEADMELALEAGIDDIILDGRGGGTGAAPEMFRDHISVPHDPCPRTGATLLRQYFDNAGASGRVTLIITGGLCVPTDFVKALALAGRRRGAVELGHAGNRLRRGSNVQLEQLAPPQRNPEARAACLARHRHVSTATRHLLPSIGGVDVGRPRSAVDRILEIEAAAAD